VFGKHRRRTGGRLQPRGLKFRVESRGCEVDVHAVRQLGDLNGDGARRRLDLGSPGAVDVARAERRATRWAPAAPTARQGLRHARVPAEKDARSRNPLGPPRRPASATRWLSWPSPRTGARRSSASAGRRLHADDLRVRREGRLVHEVAGPSRGLRLHRSGSRRASTRGFPALSSPTSRTRHRSAREIAGTVNVYWREARPGSRSDLQDGGDAAVSSDGVETRRRRAGRVSGPTTPTVVRVFFSVLRLVRGARERARAKYVNHATACASQTRRRPASGRGLMIQHLTATRRAAEASGSSGTCASLRGRKIIREKHLDIAVCGPYLVKIFEFRTRFAWVAVPSHGSFESKTGHCGTGR